MPLTVKQVLAGATVEQNLRFLIDTLESLGFITTSWQEGSVQRNVLQVCAEGITGVSGLISNFVQNVYVKPVGEWLDFIGIIRYGVSRLLAVKTKRLVTFQSSAGAPNHNINPQSIVASDGIRYMTTNTLSVFLGTGLSVDIEVEAEFGGANGNVPSANSLELQTAYTGVTVSFNGDPTTPGTDTESDDRYWARCQLAWAALTYSSGLRAYEYWALTASASTNRAKALNNYPTPNAVRVVLDPGTAAEIALVKAYVIDKHPPNDDVTVSQRAEYAQAIVLSPTVPKGTLTGDITDAIDRMLDALPIGGTVPAGAVVGKLLTEAIAKPILCDSGGIGARSVGLATPAADVVLGATDIVIPSYTVTPEYF
jgi:hypothetical protein